MDKFTKAQSGKLGGTKWAEKSKILATQRIDEYNSSPKLCRECSKTLKYNQRKSTYCSRSCAATVNNRIPKREKTGIRCIECNKITILKSKCNECNNTERFELGKISDRGTLRTHILKTRMRECECCKLTMWNGMEIPLELDHIDGNAGNNLPSNLRFLCPNCHAQTPTHKAKNKGNGRKSRGLPTH